MAPELSAPHDRHCGSRALDSPLRRWLSPPSREVDRLGPLSGHTVADLGAGTGYFGAEILRRIGPQGRLYLVDPDATNLGIARRRLQPLGPVEAQVGVAEDVPWISTATVDRALLSLALCCIGNKAGAMSETWRILRPGGRALITYPALGLPRRGSRAQLRMTEERWHPLRTAHPWLDRPVASHRWVRRHLVEKPAAA